MRSRWYVSRRLVRPLLALSRAADEVAGGNYDVERARRGAPGEIGHLAERFEEMAAAADGVGGARAELPDVGLARAAHAADRDPRARRRRSPRGSSRIPSCGRARSRSSRPRRERLERLVGDILDLARLDAHRFTVLHEEVGMEQLVERAYETFAEQARARSIDYRVDGERAAR